MKIQRIDCSKWEYSDEFVDNWLLAASDNEIRLFTNFFTFKETSWTAFMVTLDKNDKNDNKNNAMKKIGEEYGGEYTDQEDTSYDFEVCEGGTGKIEKITLEANIVVDWQSYPTPK